MKENAGLRLPDLSKPESELVEGSFDFIGVIHYYVCYVKENSSTLKSQNRDLVADMAVELICMFLTNLY